MRHFMLVGGLLLFSAARAEGVDSGAKVPSTGERLHGASSVVPLGGGLLSTGGSTLRYLEYMRWILDTWIPTESGL